jgi:uncharacterized coiled-coil DUF342 family protein
MSTATASSSAAPLSFAQKLAANINSEKKAKESNKPANNNAKTESTGISSRGRGGRGAAGASRGGSSRGRGGRSSAAPATSNGESNGAESSDAAESSEEKQPRVKKEYKPVEKCDLPNERDYQTKSKQIEFQIAEITKKAEALTATIDAEAEKRKKIREDNSGLIDSSKSAQKERQEAFAKLNSLKAQLDQVDAAVQVKKEKLEKQRKDLKFTELADLEARIKQIEYKLETSNLPLNTEKQYIQEIKTLNSQRDAVRAYNSANSEFKENKVDTSELQTQFKAQKAVVNKLKEAEAGQQKEFEQFKLGQTSANTTITEAIEQRKALHAQRKAKNDELWQLKRAFEQQKWQHSMWLKQEEYRKKKEQWEEKKRKHEEWLAHKADREASRKQRDEEYKARQAEYEEAERKAVEEAEAAEAARDPWEEEKLTVAELQKYLRSLLPKQEQKQEAKEESKASAEDLNKTFKGKQGTALVSKKKNADHLFESVVKAKDSSKPVTAKQGKAQNKLLSHVPDTIHRFALLELAAPVTAADVPTALAKLDEKEQWLQTAPRELKQQKKEAAKKAQQESKQNKKGQQNNVNRSDSAAFPGLKSAGEEEPEPEAPGAEPQAPQLEPQPQISPQINENINSTAATTSNQSTSSQNDENNGKSPNKSDKKPAKNNEATAAAAPTPPARASVPAVNHFDPNAAEMAAAKLSNSSATTFSAKPTATSNNEPHEPSEAESAAAAALGAL